MKVIGLTGGIATGKSAVARRLREHHRLPVIDADEVARRVVEPGEPALRAIVEAFGPSVVDEAGQLKRRDLRALITSDPAARATLEAITHPAIRRTIVAELAELASRGAPLAFVEAALMVETGSYRAYDGVLVVTCSPETQLRRLVDRDGMTDQDARRLIATQMPLAEKEARATLLIRNDGDLDDLAARVDDVVRLLRDPDGRSPT